MSIRREQAERIVRKMMQGIKDSGAIVLKAPEAEVKAKIEAVLAQNMAQEEAVEAQVRRLMDQYRAQIASGNMDAQKLYAMIKRQVAKEKKFIL